MGEGGRCAVCVKTREHPEQNPSSFPVRIGGGYDVLRTLNQDGVKIFSEAVAETLNPGHSRFAHGAPGPLSGHRFHFGVVFPPATSRQHSVEPAPRRPRPTSASGVPGIESKAEESLPCLPATGSESKAGESLQRPKSAGAANTPDASLAVGVSPRGASSPNSKAMERLMEQPKPRLWRVMGEQFTLREPPPW